MSNVITLDELKSVAGVSADEICDEAYDLLTARKWEVTKDGIKKNMEVWLANKSDMIRKMVQNPNYNGNLQIVIPEAIMRTVVSGQAKGALSQIISRIAYYEDRTVDKNGLTARNHLSAIMKEMGSKSVLPSEVKEKSIADKFSVLEPYECNLICRETNKKIDDIVHALNDCYYGMSERVSDETAYNVNQHLHLDKKKIISGQKMSKVIFRILNMTDHYEKYNKMFTQFADLINENKTQGYYVVSLNFLDYLRMSDGNSWSSCHTTDYQNTRHMNNTYSGGYCQGTLSYANDSVSYVTYFINAEADVEHPDRSWKIYRNMFHVKPDESIFIQGRVYPQDNDNAGDIYGEMKRLWASVMGYDYEYVGTSRSCAIVSTNGANYDDYYQYNKCALYRKNNSVGNYDMTIGHIAYSCYNGKELSVGRHGTIV